MNTEEWTLDDTIMIQQNASEHGYIKRIARTLRKSFDTKSASSS